MGVLRMRLTSATISTILLSVTSLRTLAPALNEPT